MDNGGPAKQLGPGAVAKKMRFDSRGCRFSHQGQWYPLSLVRSRLGFDTARVRTVQWLFDDRRAAMQLPQASFDDSVDESLRVGCMTSGVLRIRRTWPRVGRVPIISKQSAALSRVAGLPLIQHAGSISYRVTAGAGWQREMASCCVVGGLNNWSCNGALASEALLLSTSRLEFSTAGLSCRISMHWRQTERLMDCSRWL